ncbi:MAG: TonB-dependent receptor [Blastocatellia bacterium]
MPSVFSRLALAFFSLLSFVTTQAQTEQSAALRGTVKEQSGGVILNAQITLTNPALNLRRVTTTNKDGAFVLLDLPPGSGYEMQVQAEQFKGSQRALPIISAGDSVTQDFTLEVATMVEAVNIIADTPPLVSNAPEVSQVVDARRITELPSARRSVNTFALLDPHIRNTAGQGSDGSSAARLAINASSFRHTNYQLDGNTNYESVYANAPQQQISLTAVQEFKVLTNQYSAEYGGTTAGIISTTTKSGTDNWHGEGFAFLRPSGMQARPVAATLRVPNENWQFGGALGGPLVKSKLNFFANYERIRQNRGAFIQSPAPATFIGQYRDNLALVRTDYRFSDTHTVGLRLNGNYNTNDNSNDAVSGFNQASTARNSYGQNVTGQLTDRKIWGGVMNEVRFSYLNTVPSGSRPLSQPSVTIIRPNYSTEGTSSYSFTRTQNYQLADQLAWQAGSHELRFGGDYKRQTVVDDSFSLFGTYTFAPGAPQVNEKPVQYAQTFGRTLLRYGQTAVAAFAQDNWRAHSRLTLNLGLRYEMQTLTAERNNFAPRLGFAWDVRGDGATVIRGGGGVFYDQYYMYITRRFLFQGPYSYTATITLKPTDAGFPTFPNSLLAPPGSLATAKRDIYLAPTRIVNPYSTQFSFGIQQKLFGGLALTVDGITQHTVRQMRAVDINAPAPFARTGPGQIRSGATADATRPFTTYLGVPVKNVVVVENSAMSDYDALDVALVKAFARRLQVEAHYLYSSATTDAMFFGEPNTGVPNDWNGNLRLEHAPSDFHQRHRFVGHGLLELPGQMQASFVLTLASGLPVDPRTGVDNNGDSNVVDRPVNPATGTVFARNSFRTPQQVSLDLSLAKRLAITEKLKLELRAEGFNLTNHANLIRVNANYGNNAQPLAPFLCPIGGISNSDPARQFQFGVRMIF